MHKVRLGDVKVHLGIGVRTFRYRRRRATAIKLGMLISKACMTLFPTIRCDRLRPKSVFPCEGKGRGREAA